ncbi:hypothetical protein BH11PSE14_BH11PSE14_09930 [soil metagenome]
MIDRPDAALLAHYDGCLQAHGDTARGADWPNEQDRHARFDVMLDVIENLGCSRAVLCDLGCGTGELLAHIRRRGLAGITYVGVDRSAQALEMARRKFPDARFVMLDANDPNAPIGALACDYLVANGLFTVKAELKYEQMWEFMASTLRAAWPQVRRGVAFNVMSAVVDWQREDLFHVPADDLLRLLHGLAGRRVRLRADYGLHEYTAYAFKPSAPAPTPVPVPAPSVLPAVGSGSRIPVMRPRLPATDRLVPYLERIDAGRIYSNFGPLATELEARLAGRFGLPVGGVASASSGLAALVGAILARAGRATSQRPYAVVPGFTFVATAVAAEQCGYLPWLADVDPTSWLMTPDDVMRLPALGLIGVVIPVATMGRPVEQAPWREFSARTGIPVVIDGAAQFDALVDDPGRYLGDVPVAVSFHATKSFGVGEGGAVASSDTAMVLRASQALNFGFDGSRDSASASTNGKMSEYHAAVGLAELDGWDEKRRAMRRVAELYRQAFTALGLSSSLHVAPSVAPNYALYLAADPWQSRRVCAALAADNLEFRQWYGLGLHRQTHFSGLSRGSLQVTDDLALRLLGLPNAPDLGDDVIARIAHAVAAGVDAGDAGLPDKP